MKDFIFRNDTKLIFRNDIRSTIADVAKGHKVMFVYGSGSVKTNGCHGDIVQTLNDTGISLMEYGGSSRELAAIEQGIRVARENDVSMIIGAGGATPLIPRSIRTVRNTFLKKISPTCNFSTVADVIHTETSKTRKSMKRTIIMTLAALALLNATPMAAARNAKGEKAQETVVRKLSEFTKISINGSDDVVYTQGNKFSVKLVGEQSLLDNTQTTVANGTLTITSRARSFRNFSKNVTVYVTSPDLTDVAIKGSGDFKCAGKIDSDDFSLALQGSGDIDIKYLICDNAKIELRGSGDIDIDRLRCTTSTIQLRGSGDIEINQEKVKNTNLSLYGSGDVQLKMDRCGVANCKLFGSGDIELSGTLSQLNKQVRGSGDISTSRLSVTNSGNGRRNR